MLVVSLKFTLKKKNYNFLHLLSCKIPLMINRLISYVCIKYICICNFEIYI